MKGGTKMSKDLENFEPKIEPRKQCAEPNPHNGFWVADVEKLGVLSYCAGIAPMMKALESEHCKQYRGDKKTSAGGWSGIPEKAFKNGKRGTLSEVYASMLSMPSKAPENMRSAVYSALPNVLREALEDEVKFNEFLGEINLDRLFSGDRRFLRRRQTAPQNRPVIGLGVPIQANCNINADIISIRAIVCAIAVEILEMRGLSVECFAVSYCSDQYKSGKYGTDGIHAVRVKKAGETMATSSIMNLMSGWSFRTAFFGLIEYAGEPVGWYGHARKMPDASAIVLGKALPQVDKFAMLNTYPTNNNKTQAIKDAISELMRVLEPYL